MSCHKAFPQNEAGRASASAANKKMRAAFSLIELLISLAVLSVLVVLAASLIGAIQDTEGMGLKDGPAESQSEKF